MLNYVQPFFLVSIEISRLIFPYIHNGLIGRSSESSSDTDSESTSISSSSDDEKTVSARKTGNSKHVKNRPPRNLGIPPPVLFHISFLVHNLCMFLSMPFRLM